MEFDELLSPDLRESDFYVDIVNCDANWNPTYVLPIEFYEGFTRERIDIFRRSDFTKVPYVHYTYAFPQQDEYFKMSGNYLLKVFRDNNPDKLILTQRFIVVNPRIGIQTRDELSGRVERMRMNELTFEINTSGLEMRDPTLDLKIKVLQNFRWDNAQTLGRPRFYGDQKFEYYLNLLDVFPGGNEFRMHDIRSVRLYSENVRLINEDEQTYNVILYQDRPRDQNRFRSPRDLNGQYFVSVDEWPDNDLNADYVYNLFTLGMNRIPEAEVYLFGSFTHWRALPDYRMDYNEAQSRYEIDILLKQGVYDYQYVVKTGKQIDDARLEGKHFDTENFYSVLVYYRSPADRTDQLIGFLPVNYVE